MKAFAYLTCESLDGAARALAMAPAGAAAAKGAGTDLLDLMKERVLAPDEVCDLRGARPQAPIDPAAGEVSALATLAEVAAHPWIAEHFPAVAKAAGEAATPQVRNVGTVGGNLCQHSRCWYLRQPGYACFKKGDPQCAAHQPGAENRYHGIFSPPTCACAHPSNLAPALIAVGAQVAVLTPKADGVTERTLDLAALYREPRFKELGDTALAQGELIRAVKLTPSPMTRRSTYLEVRERQSFDFALASVAAAVDLDDAGKVRTARVVCNGVAPIPHRAQAAEEALAGKNLAAAAAAAADAAVEGARPLAKNAYKVNVLRTLVRRALEELA